jgi:tRNA/rRNA methyltransferase
VKSWVDEANDNTVALVFGPEDFGLSTEDLRLCTERIRLPTAERFPSLNLAQAVLLVSYEVYCASRGGPRGISKKKRASLEETSGLYSHMEEALIRTRYFGARNTEFAMRCFQDIFTRAALSPDEVRMWRGVFSRVIRLADRLEGEGEDLEST